MQQQNELRKLCEQRLELARLITVLQQWREQRETTSAQVEETNTTEQGEIPESIPAPLMALLDALHIDPP